MRGTQVGSYIIEDKIGEGGMGVVYSAKHARMNRQAVVKVLRKHLIESPEMARRFENEANAAASIGHPGIVQVFDIGQQDDGSLYIVMELLAGESLQDRLDRLGKLSVQQAVRIVNQCADALGAAHAAGITHRDLKPDNIFLVPDSLVPGGERAKLLDFGIAKLQVDGMATMGTAMGTLMGTPPYMSPEQCQGAGGVQNSSDLYALGCILFQLVSGRTPFVGKGPGDYIVAHTTQAPPLLRTFAPHAPEALQEIVSMLLAKKPEDRFASCAALCSALSSIPGGDTLDAASPGAVATGPTDSAHFNTGPTAPAPVATEPTAPAPVATGPTAAAPVATGPTGPRMAATKIASNSTHPPTAAQAATAAPSAVQGHPGGQPGTTLGLSAGEKVTAPSVHHTQDVERFPNQGGGKAKVAAIGAALTLVLVGVGFAALGGGGGTSTSAVEGGGAADAQIEMVRYTLRLEPPAAEIFVAGTLVPPSADESRLRDGGVAPERVISLARGREVVLEVRSPGFESREWTIMASSDKVLTIELVNSVRELEMRQAEVRLAAWMSAPVKTHLSIAGEKLRSEGNFKTAEGKTKLRMKFKEISVICGVIFGEDGNPSELTNCTAIGEKFSVEPKSFECSPARKRLVCKASRIRTRLDGESERATLKVSRPLGEADARADLSDQTLAEVPSQTPSEPSLPALPVTKPRDESTGDLAAERRNAWMGGFVGTRFKVLGESMPATGRFRVTRGKTKLIVNNDGKRTVCDVEFGSDGNPAMLVTCSSKGQKLHMKPKAFDCSLSKKRLICRASNFTFMIEGDPIEASFRVHRPAIAADR